MSDLSQYLPEGFLPEEDDGGGNEYGIMPVGWYPAEITAVSVSETKSGTGVMLTAEFTIRGESYYGRKVWERFNIMNQSQQAQAIGQRELGRMMRALKFGENERLIDENQLLGRSLDIRIKIEKGQNGYEDRNAVDKFARAGEGGKDQVQAPQQAAQQYQNQSPAPRPAPAQATVPGIPAAPAAKRPWER